MKYLIAAVGALALASTAANAVPVNKYTITGYAASSAVERGVALDQSRATGQDRNEAYGAAVAGGANVAPEAAPHRSVRRAAPIGR